MEDAVDVAVVSTFTCTGVVGLVGASRLLVDVNAHTLRIVAAILASLTIDILTYRVSVHLEGRYKTRLSQQPISQ